jgi:hypothetical protein
LVCRIVFLNLSYPPLYKNYFATLCQAKPSRLCEKSTEVSSPRKRGSKPCEHKLDSHFRGNDKTGGIGFYTVSIPLPGLARVALFELYRSLISFLAIILALNPRPYLQYCLVCLKSLAKQLL